MYFTAFEPWLLVNATPAATARQDSRPGRLPGGGAVSVEVGQRRCRTENGPGKGVRSHAESSGLGVVGETPERPT